MNTLQIEYFLEVANKASFTKASKSLYVSQPSISRQIAMLEAELGTTLFDRTRSGAQLTISGKLFFELFKRFKSELQDTKEEAIRLTEGTAGALRIGFVEGWELSELILSLRQTFAQKYQNIKLEFFTYPVRELLAKLQSNDLDCAICMDAFIDTTKNVERIQLMEMNNILLYSSKHRLVDKPDLSPVDFQNDPLYVLNEDESPIVRVMNDMIFRSYGFEPKIVEMSNRDSILLEISSGVGYAMFDRWFRAKDFSSYKYILLDISLPISLTWKRSNNSDFIHFFGNEVLFKLNNENQIQDRE